jgi:hypothetical protein
MLGFLKNVSVGIKNRRALKKEGTEKVPIFKD